MMRVVGVGQLRSAICPENGSCYCHALPLCCCMLPHIRHVLHMWCMSLTLLSLASSDLAKSFELRKGLDVNIASAMASEPSDRTKILNSIRLPRAGTVFLEQEARDAHESNLIDLWSSFPSDFLSPRAESTLTQRDHVPKMPSVSLSFCRLRNLFQTFALRL